jgi:hypothetical protein
MEVEPVKGLKNPTRPDPEETNKTRPSGKRTQPVYPDDEIATLVNMDTGLVSHQDIVGFEAALHVPEIQA